MALISLFTTTRAKLDQMELDASISETHEAPATVSQSAIEDGDNVADNVTLGNIKLTMEATISKTPLGVTGLIGSASTAVGTFVASKVKSKAVGLAAVAGAGSLAGIVSGKINGPGGSFVDADGVTQQVTRRPSDVYEYLLELRKRRQPFDVVTALKKYSNMIITNISVPRTNQTTGELRFTVNLEQVQLVVSQVASITIVSALGAAAGGKQTQGKQSASAVTPKTEERASGAFKLSEGKVPAAPGFN